MNLSAPTLPTAPALQRILCLCALGFIGILSMLPLIPQLAAFSPEPMPFPLPVMLILITLQSGLLLLLLIGVGSFFAPKVQLSTPLIDALLLKQNPNNIVKKQLIAGIIGGVIGGIGIVIFAKVYEGLLPPEFIANAEQFTPAWYTRLAYGGITEEILMRWGLMSLFVWCSYRLLQHNGEAPKQLHYVIGIILASILFGVGHLPTAYALSPVVDVHLITYILVGNAFGGLITGYLFWKHGLECAFIAHMSFHLMMIILI